MRVCLQVPHVFLQLLLGDFTAIVTKDGLQVALTRRVEHHQGPDVLPEGLRNTRQLLGEQPHAHVVVPAAEGQLHQLRGPSFYVVATSYVVQYKECQCISAREACRASEFVKLPVPEFEVVG